MNGYHVTMLCAVLSLLPHVSLADVYVSGYVRSDGTYVSPHYRSSPNGTRCDNWSAAGNVNPYTGKVGTNNYPECCSSAQNYPSDSVYTALERSAKEHNIRISLDTLVQTRGRGACITNNKTCPNGSIGNMQCLRVAYNKMHCAVMFDNKNVTVLRLVRLSLSSNIYGQRVLLDKRGRKGTLLVEITDSFEYVAKLKPYENYDDPNGVDKKIIRRLSISLGIELGKFKRLVKKVKYYGRADPAYSKRSMDWLPVRQGFVVLGILADGSKTPTHYIWLTRRY